MVVWGVAEQWWPVSVVMMILYGPVWKERTDSAAGNAAVAALRFSSRAIRSIRSAAEGAVERRTLTCL